MIDYHRLKAWQFPEIKENYDSRDCRLYALGLNLGNDPMDELDLRHVADEPALPLPMMISNLCRLGSWMRDPEVGIDYSKIVVGSVALKIMNPLEPRGQVSAHHKVTSIVDKGESRGAIVTVRRTISSQTGTPIGEFEQSTFCRADGGFSAENGVTDVGEASSKLVMDRNADLEFEHPTLPQQALIYRLTGDMNPLHSNPAVALQAGFERPILHGLATFGIAGWSLIRSLVPTQPEALCGLSCRMSAPVIPGCVLTTRAWKLDEPGSYFFEVEADGRRVLTGGRAQFNSI